MSLSKLAAWHDPHHNSPGYVAATAVLGMLGLVLLVFLQAVAPPGQQLFWFGRPWGTGRGEGESRGGAQHSALCVLLAVGQSSLNPVGV